MSQTLDAANRAVSRIRSMPYGVARTESAVAQVRRTEEEGPDAALAYALFALVESYVWGAEPDKAYVPFRQLVRLWDTRPELFDEGDRHDLFWAFKWMVAGLKEHPEIPATQIDATIADMERRYAVAGNGMDAVAYSAFTWARHRRDPETELAFTAWSTTPRDEYSQCEACELGDQAVYYAETDRLEEAVRTIENVPPTTRWCATEPADMLSVLALAHLELGHPAEALAAHRRAVAALADAESDMAAARGRRLELLARGGQAERALAALQEDAALLLRADSPLSRLGFLLAVLRAVSALRTLPAAQEAVLALPGVPATSLVELRDWVHQEARTLAQAFDARNERTTHGDLVESALRTGPLAPLDFTVIAPSAVPGRTGAVPVVSGDDAVAGASGAPDAVRLEGPDLRTAAATEPGDAAAPTALQEVARAEELLEAGDPTAAAAAWTRAAALADAAGLLEVSGTAWAEAAHVAAELQDDAGAHAAFAAAVPRLRAAAADPALLTRVLQDWAPVAAGVDARTDVLVALAAAREDVERGLTEPRDDLAPALAERERSASRRLVADLDDTAARLLASGDAAAREEAVTTAVRAAEAFAAVGDVADAAHAFWLAGRVQRGLGRVEDAVWSLESAVEGFGMTPQRQARGEAGNELVELLRSTGQDAKAEEILALLAS